MKLQGGSVCWKSAIEIQKILTEVYEEFVQKKTASKPLMVGICGIPGSGKSFCARQIKELYKDSPVVVVTLPMDGYHIPLKDLSPDRVYYRGAIDTFNLKKLAKDLKVLHSSTVNRALFPAFDHEKGDPEEEAIEVSVGNSNAPEIVVVEGLYTLADELRAAFDVTIFLEADLEKCVARLKIRNQVIPGYSKEEIEERVDKSDRVNALQVIAFKSRADRVVQGFDEDSIHCFSSINFSS